MPIVTIAILVEPTLLAFKCRHVTERREFLHHKLQQLLGTVFRFLHNIDKTTVILLQMINVPSELHFATTYTCYMYIYIVCGINH